jgi:hypothetical protein
METLDRRWAFLIVGIAVSLPWIKRAGFPVTPSPEARAFYEAVETLPPGSVIYLAADMDPGSQAELLPMLTVFVDQACRLGHKIVAGSLWPAAPPIVDAVLNEVAVEKYHREYGKDFVNLGFKEGREAVMVMLAQDLRAAYPADNRGTPIDQLPILAEVRSFKDIALIVSISAGYPGTKEWVQQVQARHSVPMVSGCTAVSAPEYYPYVQAKQLSGLLGGMAGAAEYETSNSLPGMASKAMDSQSLGHLAVIVLIAIGNVTYFARRRGRGSR